MQAGQDNKYQRYNKDFKYFPGFLIDRFAISFIVVYFSQVKAMAKQRKASIVENEADATHILHPTTDPDGEMFCRGVFKRGLQCLVHFYRMPESHDNWGQVRKDKFFYCKLN